MANHHRHLALLAALLVALNPLTAALGEPQAQPPSSVDLAVRATSGMGMYIWRWSRTGTVDQVVEKARTSGISHLIVRASSQSEGLYLLPVLSELIPKAHAAGLKVVAYDPPRFENIDADAQRAYDLVSFRVNGQGIDAFAADIEPAWSLLTAENAERYGARLRELIGPHFPLVGIVYPPNQVGARFPFAAVAKYFDVLSPMSYWRALTLDGPGYTRASIEQLKAYGKPVTALGQAFSYDGHRNAGLRGFPPPDEFAASIAAAREAGAVGMSFWVWEHAQPWVFDAIKAANWPGIADPGIGSFPPGPPPVAPVVTPQPPAPPAVPAVTAPPAADVRTQAAGLTVPVPLPSSTPVRRGAVAALILAVMAVGSTSRSRRFDRLAPAVVLAWARSTPAVARRAAEHFPGVVLEAAERGAQPLLAWHGPPKVTGRPAEKRSARPARSSRPADSGSPRAPAAKGSRSRRSR